MTDTLADAGLLGPGLVRRGAGRVHLRVPALTWRARAFLFAAVTWLPLAILTIIEGTFRGRGWTFSRDIGSYVRFLLVGPLLVAIEPWVERELSTLIPSLRTSALVPVERRPVFDRFLERQEAWRRAYGPQVLLLLLSYAIAAITVGERAARGDQPWLFGAGAPGPLSWAGWWWVLVAGPLFAHVVLRWLWRFGVWTALLFRLASLPARVFGTHADCMGGLLGVAKHHHVFIFLPLSLSLMAAATGANVIFHRGVPLASLRHVEILIVALELVVFIGPLLFFTPLMVAARRRAAARYGAVAAHHATHLEHKIDAALADQKSTPRLSADVLEEEAHLSASFEDVREMTSAPLTRESLVMFILACTGPLLLLELTEMPAGEILEKMKGLLL